MSNPVVIVGNEYLLHNKTKIYEEINPYIAKKIRSSMRIILISYFLLHLLIPQLGKGYQRF